MGRGIDTRLYPKASYLWRYFKAKFLLTGKISWRSVKDELQNARYKSMPKRLQGAVGTGKSGTVLAAVKHVENDEKKNQKLKLLLTNGSFLRPKSIRELTPVTHVETNTSNQDKKLVFFFFVFFSFFGLFRPKRSEC